MKTQVSMLSVLLMVKNTISSQRNARLVPTGGVYLQKNEKEIFVCFGGIKSIQVFYKSELIEVLNTSRHDEMDKAEKEAYSIIKKIYQILDEKTSN
ncbi:hypothetical protein [Acinetobacter calcoaceticus]|uniref:hypothetical protein n=1 Tax=Acinetobacter calcoaceticus TaxID=471 RepID=UPI00124E5D34|nr:hypothetical protein [Acinetobacter calcoaceticus]